MDLSRVIRTINTFILYFIFIFGALLNGVVIYFLLLLLVWNKETRKKALRYVVKLGFKFFIFLARILFVFRVDFVNLDKCNSFNGSLIVANHPTLLDYVILTSKLSVNTCSMVKRKLLDTFMRPIIKHLDYVNNEDSIELITNKTDQGEDILIFPEGTRTKDFNNVSFVRGVANLACRKGLKVVCLHIYCDDQGYLNRGFYSFKAPSKIPTYYIEYIDTLDSRYFVENESRLPIAARKFNEHLEKFYNDCYIRVKGNYERK